MESTGKKTSIDPQLTSLLDVLCPTPDRDPEVLEANRVRFETELDAYLLTYYEPLGLDESSPVGVVQTIMEFIKMMTLKYRVGLIIAAVIFAVGLVVFTGAGATVSAAQDALPGDALYSIKTGWEQTQARFNRDSYEQALMYLEFAEVRLNEIESLIAVGRYSDIASAVDEFEFYLQLVVQSLGQLDGSDPQQAAELSNLISNAISRYAGLITGMLAQVPASAHFDLQRALLTSGNVYSYGDREEVEITGVVESITDEVWVVNGRALYISPWTEINDSPSVGDMVKVHAYVTGDGTLTAREIVRFVPGDDGNINSNDTDDGEMNANPNDISDDDRDSNANTNDNDDDWNATTDTNGDQDDGDSNTNSDDDPQDDDPQNDDDHRDNEDDNDGGS